MVVIAAGSACLLALALESRAGEGKAEPAPVFHVLEVRHRGSWTGGEPDRLRALGIRGTDLGVSFPLSDASGRERLCFLFGDTWTTGRPFTGRWDVDSAAFSSPEWRERSRLPALTWATRRDGEFLGLAVRGVALGGMNVPLDGVRCGGRTLLFFNTGYVRGRGHRELVCAEAAGEGLGELALRFRQATTRFLNVSVSPDPRDPETVWIFGTGRYRKSDIFLARAPAGHLHDFSRWRFFAGPGLPFAESEARARPLVATGFAGEISARFIEPLEAWVLAWQARRPERGVHLRFARHPAGPWSEPVLGFSPDPGAPRGYVEFMHAKESVVGFDDGLSEPGREEVWGGEYGPYLVPSWCRKTKTGVSLVHVLSSWNPYQVHLVEVRLSTAPRPAESVEEPGPSEFAPVPLPPFAKWRSEGDPFRTYRAEDGAMRLTTFTEKGDRASGSLRTRVTVPPGASWLRFDLHGGDARVRLYDWAGRWLRESRGRKSNQRSVRCAWYVAAYRKQSVTVAVEDRLTGPWGFVDLSAPSFTTSR